jgi:tetratricopeptide (TPR) repeat protein
LAEAGEARPDLRRSRAAALTEMSITLARQGDLAGAEETAAEATVAFRSLIDAGGAEARADLAVGLDREGDIRLQIGDTPTAAALYAEAHALNTALVEVDPRTTWRINLAVSEEKLGDIAALNDKPDEAFAAFARALLLRNDGASRGVAVLYEKQGDALVRLDRPTDAHAAYLESLTLTEMLAVDAPDDTRFTRDQSVIRQKLGDLLLRTDGPEAALPHFTADLEIARRLNGADPAREDWALDLAVSLDRFGVLQFQLGNTAHAARLLDEAFALLSGRAIAKPARADLQSYATKASQKLSLISFATGDVAKAATAAHADEQRLGEAVAAGAPLEDEHAGAINNVAWYSLFTDDPAAALAAARRATEMRPAAMIYRLNLAHALLLSGEGAEAMTVYQGNDIGEWKAMIAADFDEFTTRGVALDVIDSARAALLH